MDLISRLSELRSQYSCFSEGERDAYQTLSEAIKALQEPKTGRWVHAYDCDCFQCNQCGTPSIVAQPYCCICGAKMEV